MNDACADYYRESVIAASNDPQTMWKTVTLTKAPTVVIAFDLAAAFDCVSHQKLTEHLSSEFGVGGLVLRWIGSYLEGKTQFVKVGEAVSRTMEVVQAVPQGLVLGPMLYTTYVSLVS